MATIKEISAREILDSRGIPTIEGRLLLDNGAIVTASAPSGESVGKYEAVELRDKEKNRLEGLGVTRAVSFINDLIGPRLTGVSPKKQTDIDFWLNKADGTPDKSRLGINTITTISQLVAKAGALVSNMPLYQYINLLYNQTFKKKVQVSRIPSPIFSLINGGKHGTKNLQFQEFQVIPPTNFSYSQALQTGSELYLALKKILEHRNAGTSVSEEGGFTPNILTNTDALELIKEVLPQKNLRLGADIFLGLDLAASNFYIEGKYSIRDKSQPVKIDEFIEYLINLVEDYNVLVVEDPLEEEDYTNWSRLTKKIGQESYIVADDLIAGNKSRLERAIKEAACNGIVVKFNQFGSITEMLEIINLAKEASFKIITSHRLGETNDSIIADFAVATQADFVKFGSPVRGERVAKYNRLLAIERMLGVKS